MSESDTALMRRALEALEGLLTPCAAEVHEPSPDGECPTCPVEDQARAVIAALNERLNSQEDINE